MCKHENAKSKTDREPERNKRNNKKEVKITCIRTCVNIRPSKVRRSVRPHEIKERTIKKK